MRVSADTTSPASLPSGSQAGHANSGKNAENGFDHALRHAGKSARAHNAASAETTRERPGWTPFAENIADRALDAEIDDKMEADEAASDADETLEQEKSHRGQSDLTQTRAALPWSPSLQASYRHQPKAEASAAHPDGKAEVGKNTAAGEPVAAIMPAAKQDEALPDPGGNSDKTTPHDDLPDMLKTAARKPQEPVTSQDNSTAAASDRSGATAKPVTVTAAQSFVAPAPYPASPTITALASAIATGGDAKQILAASAGLNNTATPVAVASHMLKIELHPAELGMVTANLRLSGGQLSIELKPENQEAHRRLSSDSDTLVKSLQGLGFTVDKITVLQPSVAVNAAPRTDVANPTGRDPSSFQSGNSGGNGAPSGGQQFGRNRGDDGQHASQTGTHARERSGGGLFI